jgi:hypothetical protein
VPHHHGRTDLRCGHAVVPIQVQHRTHCIHIPQWVSARSVAFFCWPMTKGLSLRHGQHGKGPTYLGALPRCLPRGSPRRGTPDQDAAFLIRGTAGKGYSCAAR